MVDLIYTVKEGENQRYKEKVCKNKIPYISISETTEGILYNVDLSYVGTILSEDGKKRLQEMEEVKHSNSKKLFFLVGGDLDRFHKDFINFITQRGNLEKDPNSEINFNFDKMSNLLQNDIHWQYWNMLNDYANFRKRFRYYNEAYRMSRELYLKEKGSILDVGSKDVTITLEMFPDSFEKFMLDKDYPEGFKPERGITKIEGDIYTIELERRFDLVFCQQVLEHLENPEVAFKRLIDFSNGILVISVPYGSWHETKWDPINEERVFQWSKMKPELESIVMDLGVERYIAAYMIER